MKTLSSQDEILLLAIIKLGMEAYGITIRRYVSKITGKEWSIGAIYDPLYRMEERGWVESHLSQPTQERGGRSKRIFKVTLDGRQALMKHKRVRDELWGNLPDAVLSEQ